MCCCRVHLYAMFRFFKIGINPFSMVHACSTDTYLVPASVHMCFAYRGTGGGSIKGCGGRRTWRSRKRGSIRCCMRHNRRGHISSESLPNMPLPWKWPTLRASPARSRQPISLHSTKPDLAIPPDLPAGLICPAGSGWAGDN